MALRAVIIIPKHFLPKIFLQKFIQLILASDHSQAKIQKDIKVNALEFTIRTRNKIAHLPTQRIIDVGIIIFFIIVPVFL